MLGSSKNVHINTRNYDCKNGVGIDYCNKK